jgi:hypothetical protein
VCDCCAVEAVAATVAAKTWKAKSSRWSYAGGRKPTRTPAPLLNTCPAYAAAKPVHTSLLSTFRPQIFSEAVLGHVCQSHVHERSARPHCQASKLLAILHHVYLARGSAFQLFRHLRCPRDACAALFSGVTPPHCVFDLTAPPSGKLSHPGVPCPPLRHCPALSHRPMPHLCSRSATDRAWRRCSH